MKKLFLSIIGLALILSNFSSISARELITAEENSTVMKLTKYGVIEKHRTQKELNQPMSAIDCMSMQIKALQLQDKWYNDFFHNNFTSLQSQVNSNRDEIFELQQKQDIRINTEVENIIDSINQSNHLQDRKIDDNFWLNIGFSVGLFFLGLMI